MITVDNKPSLINTFYKLTYQNNGFQKRGLRLILRCDFILLSFASFNREISDSLDVLNVCGALFLMSLYWETKNIFLSISSCLDLIFLKINVSVNFLRNIKTFLIFIFIELYLIIITWSKIM